MEGDEYVLVVGCEGFFVSGVGVGEVGVVVVVLEKWKIEVWVD